MCELCNAKKEIKKLKNIVIELRSFIFGIQEATAAIEMVGSNPRENLRIIKMQSAQAEKILRNSS